jgi:hypothetical protein
MDIAQFNAMLHSKKDQTQLMSALSTLTTITDLDILTRAFVPMGGWSFGWR